MGLLTCVEHACRSAASTLFPSLLLQQLGSFVLEGCLGHEQAIDPLQHRRLACRRHTSSCQALQGCDTHWNVGIVVQNGAFVFHQMVLSFSTKPLLHSRSPRKISLGHIWGCTILFVSCQKALGWSHLLSSSTTTPLFFLSQLSQLDFSYPSKQSQTTLSQDLGDQKQDLCTFLPLSSFPTHLGSTTLGAHSGM